MSKSHPLIGDVRTAPSCPAARVQTLAIALPSSGSDMTDAQIEASLVAILREVSANLDLRADKATMLRDIADWDSMSAVEAILLIEARCAIELGFDEFHAAATIGELLALLSKPRHRTASCPVPVTPPLTGAGA